MWRAALLGVCVLLLAATSAHAQFLGDPHWPGYEQASERDLSDSEVKHFAAKLRGVRAALPDLKKTKLFVHNVEPRSADGIEIAGGSFMTRMVDASYETRDGKDAYVEAFLFPNAVAEILDDCVEVRRKPEAYLECKAPDDPGMLAVVFVFGDYGNSEVELRKIRPARPKSGPIPVQSIGIYIFGDAPVVRRVARNLDRAALRKLIDPH